MSITADRKQELIKDNATKAGDTGSRSTASAAEPRAGGA